jgi:DNA-binding cell septation regulator SpoVG
MARKVLSKIQQVQSLFENYKLKDDESLKTKAIEESINLCSLNSNSDLKFQPLDKLKILEIVSKYDSIVASEEILARWRDSLNFLKDTELHEMIKMLYQATEIQDINSHERIYTAVHLYNIGSLDYNCFEKLASDETLLIEHRLEAVRFLYSADEPKERDIAKSVLIKIISEESLPCKFRYETIATYISKTGISSLMNTQKIKVPYDEGFVFCLQDPFFWNSLNDTRYRILSGQHLLQMSSRVKFDRIKIEEVLLHFSQDIQNSENTRADAADVVLRLGSSVNRMLARAVITELGFSADGEKKHIKTIYDDSQNVHNSVINDQVNSFLTKILDPSSRNSMKSFKDINHEISVKIREDKYGLSQKIKNAIYKTLSRISVDTASFTKYNATLAEILCHVWARIHSKEFDKDVQDLLEIRLFDELSDMSDTCSSGHASRFVNVFSTVDTTLAISWEDQIKANLKGRIQAKIRDCKDEDTQAAIAMGTMEGADKEDILAYHKFLLECITEIHEILIEEFVDEGYIKENEFEAHFEKAKREWIS